MRPASWAFLLAILVFDTAAPARCPPAASPLHRGAAAWGLAIETRDVDGAGPQLTTTMSPAGDNAKGCVAFNLNSRDSPFRAGGLQVQVWDGGKKLLSSDSQHNEPLETPDESISWTQSLSISN